METLPENFQTTIHDFTKGLSVTFPEYTHLWNEWTKSSDEMDETIEKTQEKYKTLFQYMLNVFPERFFDIIYQNNDIFGKDSLVNTFFLPKVDFKILYNFEDISETTKKTMWKYLQLILLTISSSIKDKSDFGDTAKLFECINENELQEKLQETMSGISDFFTKMTPSSSQTEGSENESMDNEKTNFTFDSSDGVPNLPNLENLQEQLKGLFDGKIGKLAKELAEDITSDFSNILDEEDTKDIKSTGDVFKKIMKNPGKMMDLVKTIGDKIKTKMETGEISRDELMKEATDILQKMKGMNPSGEEDGESPLNDILKSFANMSGGNLGGGGMNTILKNLAKTMGKNMNKPPTNHHSVSKKSNEPLPLPLSLPSSKDYILEKTNKPNNYVYKLPGEEEQSRSTKPLTDAELIAEFEKDGITTNPHNHPKKKQNKKKKTK